MKRSNDISFVQIVSAMLIVNYHTGKLSIPYLNKIAEGGFIFNTIFVFLSGYLLAQSLGKREQMSFKEFMWRRIHRLYPSLHISLLIIIIIYLLIGKVLTIPSILFTFTGFQYFAKITILGEHLWFISVILICYILTLPTYQALKHLH